SRQQLSAYLGCDPKDIVFTSGGTEADNWALGGVLEANQRKGRHLIVSQIEHHAVFNVAKHLARRGLAEVSFVEVDAQGRVNPERVAELIRDDTVLVSIMAANNEVGTIQPIAEIGRICRERGVIFHCDAVQAGGKLRIDVDELGVDLLSLSAHKFYGPKGIGLLYVRPRTKIVPLIRGGHHERGRRAGTENVASIVGMGRAIELAGSDLDQENARLAAMRDRFEAQLKQKIGYLVFNGHPQLRLSNTSNVTFAFVEGEAMLLHLDMRGIAISTGSACTSETLGASHVLAAMGLPPEFANGAVRFSLGRHNTDEQLDATVEALVEIVGRLREMSPLWDKLQKGTYDPAEFDKLSCYFCSDEGEDAD
ncbi:MAG: cysteine desulfurase family protein, partial [Candidatus Alcyoniella australis]|nr:cysteine desulfurase family protein [Candidatus Alcyoniella australis]